jgi:hypothetical protein
MQIASCGRVCECLRLRVANTSASVSVFVSAPTSAEMLVSCLLAPTSNVHGARNHVPGTAAVDIFSSSKKASISL